MANITQQRDPLAEAICAREAVLRSQRSNWETLWQSVARYVMPREATFTEKVTEGHERNRWVLDSTGPRSNELFASFLHTLMNNPGRQWFHLALVGQDKPSTPQAQWLEATAAAALRRMVRAKIYEQLHQAFLHLGAFGTAVIYVEGAPSLSIRHFHLGDCVIDEGDSGDIDAMYRQLMRTPRQAIQRWGEERVSKDLLDAAKAGRGEEKVRFLHAVFPMDEPALGALMPPEVRNLGAPFASVWVDTRHRRTMSVGHYHEFPYMVPRWYQTNDELYGRSPAMSVLPSIRMANRMLETILRGAEKLVDPPLLIPDGAMLSPVRLFPGGISFSDGLVTPQPLIPPGASRIEVGNALLEKTQADVEKGFFVPLFVDIDEKVKTATQVLQEADERNRAVSPMLMRQTVELYDPLIRRVFKVLERAGELPEPPADLRGELTVEYVSPLIASQRQIEGLSLARLFEGLAPWGGLDPGVFDHFDPDQVSLVMHAASGAPAKVLRDSLAVKRVRDARAKQQQNEAQLQQLQVGADAGSKLMTAAAKGGPR